MKYRWNVNMKAKVIRLETESGEIVMDFVKWGMGGACPRFNINGLMVRADENLREVPGREHHASWFQEVDCQAADAIVKGLEYREIHEGKYVGD